MRKPKQTGSIKERIDQILSNELEVERDEDLTPTASLDSFPGYDEDWSISYLAALLEEEFTIDIPDEAIAKLKTVQNVYDLIARYHHK